jgi:hypothetical protein
MFDQIDVIEHEAQALKKAFERGGEKAVLALRAMIHRLPIKTRQQEGGVNYDELVSIAVFTARK